MIGKDEYVFITNLNINELTLTTSVYPVALQPMPRACKNEYIGSLNP